jgi:indole-3-glycerol phosphate synthase
VLESLYAGALEDARAREQQLSLSKLEALVAQTRKPISARLALKRSENIRVIAEIKRASPSKGDLNPSFDAAQLAGEYETAGASAISVLTEQRGFKGSLEDLAKVRTHTSVPLLRKDFISTEYQLLEARAFGADFALLIVAGLTQKKLEELMHFASEIELEALVETHSEEEVRVAAGLGASLIGVNARDLSTFETDSNLFARVAELIPDSAVRIAESAVRNASDVRRYRQAGADAVLVGEALVTGDPKSLIRDFLAV